MELIHYDILEIIRREIPFIQVLCTPQRCRGRKDYRLIRTLSLSIKKSILVGMSYIPKRYRCLLQDLLPVCNKQDPFIPPGIECREIGLSYSRSRLYQTFHCPLCPGTFQCAKRFNLCAAGFKEHPDLCIRILPFFALIIPVKILRGGRSVPVLRIFFQRSIIDADRMIFEKILKRPEKLLIIIRISRAAEAIVPFNSRGQCTAGNVRRPYKNFIPVFIVKDIRFGMKRTFALVIKAQIHALSQLMLDEIQR